MPFQREHFAAGSLPNILTSVSAVGGVNAVDTANSELTSVVTSTASDIAFHYLNTPISTTEDKIIRVCFRSTGATRFPSLWLIPSASAPAAGTTAAYTAAALSQFTFGTVTAKRGAIVNKWDSSNVNTQWDTTTNTWLAAAGLGYSGVTEDDYHEVMLEIDSTRGYRWMMSGAYDSTNASRTNTQGYKGWIFTDWVTFASSRSTGANALYLVLGYALTDAVASAGAMRTEWLTVSTGAREYFTYNQNSGTGYYTIGLGYRLGDDKRAVPFVRGVWFDRGVLGTDNTSVQHRAVIQLADGSYVMYYKGTGTAGTLGAVHAATFANWGDTPTRVGALVTTTAAGTDRGVMSTVFAVIDYTDPDPNRRYKILGGWLNTTDSKLRTFVSYSASPTSGFSTEATPLVPVGGSGAYDEFGGNSGYAFWYNGQWEFWHETRAAAGSTYLEVSRCYGPSLTANALTKDAARSPIISKWKDQREAITASFSGRTVLVADTTGFVPEQTVLVDDDLTNTNWCISRVRKVTTNTSIELYHGLMGYGATAKIYGMQAGAQTVHEIRPSSSGFEYYTSCFGITGPDVATINAFSEHCVLITAPALLGTQAADWINTPLVGHHSPSPGLISNENPAFAHGATWPVTAGQVRRRRRTTTATSRRRGDP